MGYYSALKMSKPELCSVRRNPTNTMLAKGAKGHIHSSTYINFPNRQNKTIDLRVRSWGGWVSWAGGSGKMIDRRQRGASGGLGVCYFLTWVVGTQVLALF